METKICLDTSTLVNLLRNKQQTVEFFKKHEQSILATTHLTLFELHYGAYKSNNPKELIAVELLRQRLIILNIDDTVARKAGEIAASLAKQESSSNFAIF